MLGYSRPGSQLVPKNQRRRQTTKDKPKKKVSLQVKDDLQAPYDVEVETASHMKFREGNDDWMSREGNHDTKNETDARWHYLSTVILKSKQKYLKKFFKRIKDAKDHNSERAKHVDDSL